MTKIASLKEQDSQLYAYCCLCIDELLDWTGIDGSAIALQAPWPSPKPPTIRALMIVQLATAICCIGDEFHARSARIALDMDERTRMREAS